MYANVAMSLNHAEDVMTIPVSAIVLHDNRDQVYVLDGGNRVNIRDVQVGIEANQLAEIKTGLQPGDKVIMAGQTKYSDGEQVTPQVATTPASETAPQSGGMIDINGDAAASTSGGQ
jgi:hypothetical protein